MNRRRVPTPRTVSGAKNAGTLWHDSSIRVILENIVYTGNLVQHWDETIDFISKKRRKVPQDKQIVNLNTHVALINHDEHLAALEKMRTKGIRNSNGQESLFAHIAVCADCGKGMMYRKDRGKGGAYVCGKYVKNGKQYCTSHLIDAPNLLRLLRQNLRR